MRRMKDGTGAKIETQFTSVTRFLSANVGITRVLVSPEHSAHALQDRPGVCTAKTSGH